jgi:predicted nucleic acid-binding protein
VNAYVDSSVLLRVVLGEPARLGSWGRIDVAISSELIRIECLRTIDRARILLRLDDQSVAERRAAVIETLEGFSLMPVTTAVLERASDPFPTLIDSLDAIHLASALLARQVLGPLTFATHDSELALAARSVGFAIEGV